MSFIRNAFQTMHPAVQVIMLGCLVLTLMALSAGVAVMWITEGDAVKIQSIVQQGAEGELNRSAVFAMNNANQIMAFLGASFAFAALVGMPFLGRFYLRAPTLKMLGVSILMALSMSPILDFTYRLNEWLLIPGSNLHQWAGGLEAQAMALTKALLEFSTTSDVWVVLISVAVLPAVCEEWLFRGTLQPILVRATGNIHFGIWVSAALFSAIHMQFFGFIPRMLLGAGFGYLVVYSGSLWPAIVSHFVNNATVVIAAWWMGSVWIEDGLEPQPLNTWTWSDWGVAVFATLALCWAIGRLWKWGNPQGYIRGLNLTQQKEGHKLIR